MTADVFDIQTYAIHDGPGIRTAVFLRGCPLRCWWCHNPEAWAGPKGCGQPQSAQELVDQILVDRAFFEESGGGVTFTGGEPTTQAAFLLEALDLLRAERIHTAIETCGQFRPALCEPLAERVDLFLFDVKHVDPKSHRCGTGSGNERILANLATLVKLVGTERIVPRVPVIPGFNDGDGDICAISDLLWDLGFTDEVHLMPYHDWARHKHEELGLEFRDVGRLDPTARDRICALFDGRPLRPVWGGGT